MNESELETMVAAYVAAALWSTTDESRDDGGDALSEKYRESDIDPKTLASFERDCKAFGEPLSGVIDGQWEEAGHDFWLTRNGHGAGFWDGTEWDDDDGAILTNACKAWHEVSLYVGDDGVIYAMGEEP